jgi:hypothetical protein
MIFCPDLWPGTDAGYIATTGCQQNMPHDAVYILPYQHNFTYFKYFSLTLLSKFLNNLKSNINAKYVLFSSDCFNPHHQTHNKPCLTLASTCLDTFLSPSWIGSLFMSGVPNGGLGVQTPRNSKVLPKLSRIPSSVEYTSVTTKSEYGFHSFANWVEPLTRGLPPPDPRSLRPLSSTECVEPPPSKFLV